MKILSTFLLLGTLLLVGCRSTGHVQYERHETLSDGRQLVQKIRVLTPSNPAVPAHVQFDNEGMSASTGNQAIETPSSKSLANLTYIGAGLLLLGALALLLKAKLPLIPAELGLALIGVGLLLIVLPSVIEAYLGYILLGLLGTGVAVLMYRFNVTQRRVKEIDPSDPTPNPG